MRLDLRMSAALADAADRAAASASLTIDQFFARLVRAATEPLPVGMAGASRGET